MYEVEAKIYDLLLQTFTHETITTTMIWIGVL